MTTTHVPKQLIDNSPMNLFQVWVVLLCILLNALDGFDVLAISFASPGIAQEWAISRASLGVVLAMELVGMAIGSITLGGLADRIGRRPTILGCLVLMTGGMYAASLVTSVNQLLVVRFITGLGIGGMLACTNAMVAEFANARFRNLAVILMATGYPIGAIIGGSVATELLQHTGWRAIFTFGAACTGAFLLIVWFALPESVEYLANRQPKNALAKINRTLRKMACPTIEALPAPPAQAPGVSYQVLFSGRFRNLTLLLMAGYFTHIMTFYFILKWIPKIVVDMGFHAAQAGSVLVWANVGGATGALILGLVTSRLPLRPLMLAVLVGSFVMVCVFGLGQNSLSQLALIAAATGFFTNAGVVGFYALIAGAFPAEIRASGTGIVIGVGRGGAALGPVIAGFLFSAGFSLWLVALVMGAGALLAAITVLALGKAIRQSQPNS